MNKMHAQKRRLRQSKARVTGLRRGKAKIAGHRKPIAEKVRMRRLRRQDRAGIPQF